MAATGRVCERVVYQPCVIKEPPLRWLSCQRCLPPSPAIGCSTCDSNSCEGRKTDDVQKRMGATCCGGSAEFALGCLQGHKNAARERAIEGPGGGTSERERPIGKQSRNNDSCPRRVDERERGA